MINLIHILIIFLMEELLQQCLDVARGLHQSNQALQERLEVDLGAPHEVGVPEEAGQV